ncbi:MAG: hypothetical protein KDB53_00010 [Planctomycetes bacterium]|nr:hypothetical protein [Planctomycetota bacterium]
MIWLRIFLAGVLLSIQPLANREAQPPAGEIAVLLWHDSPNDRSALLGLKRGLLALGLADRLRVIELQGDADRAERELVRIESNRGAALVVALGTEAARLARRHLVTTPVVFTAVTNPVLSGVVASWDGAGGRICGNSNWLDAAELIRTFRLALPEMRTLAVLRSDGNAVSAAEVAEAREVIRLERDLDLKDCVVREPAELDAVLAAALSSADALWIPIDFQLYQEEPQARIMRRARQAGVPVVSSTKRCAGAGALLVLTIDYELLGLQAAGLVKRVLLDGQDPGAIPVGRLSSHRMILDVGAARAIGRSLPLDLVFRAHQILGHEDGK